MYKIIWRWNRTRCNLWRSEREELRKEKQNRLEEEW